MIINAVRIKEGKVEVKAVEFEELISNLEPGNPDSYDKFLDSL